MTDEEPDKVNHDSVQEPMPTPDEVDAALEAYRQGHPEVFDQLLGDQPGEGPGVCALLYEARKALLGGHRRVRQGLPRNESDTTQ